MKLPNLFALCLFTLLAIPCVNAQQVYHATDFGGPGTQYLYSRLFDFNQDTAVTKSGAGITWDLSATNDRTTHLTRVLNPGEAFDFFTFTLICGFGGHTFVECSQIWANTHQAWLLDDSLTLFQFLLEDLQRYHRKTNEYLLENFIGFRTELNGLQQAAVIVYNNPDTILHFPVTFGDAYTSHTSWSLDLSATGQNIQYFSDQSRTTTIDSWGTLITPLQTFENVVRMRSEIVRHDSISTDSFQAPIEITQVEYMWFDTAYHLPVMSANGVINGSTEVMGTIEYIHDHACEPPTWDVQVSFVDSAGTIVTLFDVVNDNADEFIWDFGDGELEITEGSTSHIFPPGTSQDIAVSGCMLHCLPLNSCDFELLSIEIPTAVDPVPVERAGIRVYPNPAKERLHIVIPESIGISTYSVIDMNGKLLKHGITASNTHALQVADLAPGLYTIILDPVDESSQDRYYARFAVGS